MSKGYFFLFGLIVGAAALFVFQGAADTAEECFNGRVETIFSPGAEAEVMGLIDSANESIDVELFVFTYRPLMDALIDAKERGVAVRVILEPRLGEDNSNLKTEEYLRDNDVEVRWASLGFKITHSKFAIIDDRVVLVGSPNWSYSAMFDNREAAVIIEDGRISGEFIDVFENDWRAAG